jgi:hypothetical protein
LFGVEEVSSRPAPEIKLELKPWRSAPPCLWLLLLYFGLPNGYIAGKFSTGVWLPSPF